MIFLTSAFLKVSGDKAALVFDRDPLVLGHFSVFFNNLGGSHCCADTSIEVLPGDVRVFPVRFCTAVIVGDLHKLAPVTWSSRTLVANFSASIKVERSEFPPRAISMLPCIQGGR